MPKSLPARSNLYKLITSLSLLAAGASARLHAQDLLANGDFSAAGFQSWEVVQVSGSSISLAQENSPFTGIFPVGTSSLRLRDDDSDFEQPTLRQSFAGQSSLLLGFDFKSPAAGNGSPWYVAWQGENETTAFFFSLGGMYGASIEFNQQKLADLEPNVWYHVHAFADAPHQTIEGYIENARGQRTPFQGSFPFGVRNELNAVVISDGDAGRNEEILLDNFFSRSLSLQIVRNSEGQTVVTWLNPEFSLQSSTGLAPDDQWTTIPDAHGSYTNTSPDRIKFFRLVR